MLTRVMRRISAVISVLLFVSVPPASASPIYTFPIEGCKTTYSVAHHDYPATDILTKKGCKFVAPTSGVIDEVSAVDKYSWKNNSGALRGGLSISMIGDDGVRYYGSHLRSIPASIQPGVSVLAGRVLGAVGATGSARGTAPHLHFGISWPTPPDTWWVRRGEVLPWKYLDAWRKGKDLSPVKEVNARKLKVGEIPPVPKK